LEIKDHPMRNKRDKICELYNTGIMKPAEHAKLTIEHYNFMYAVF